MTVDVLRQLSIERGFFLRREALDCGIDDAALRRSVRARVLTKLRQGAYTFTDLWQAATEVERHAALAGAVVLANHEQVVISHTSAVALHGFETWRLPLDRVHVTRLDDGAGRTTRDAAHHVAAINPGDVDRVGGVALTTPARAALECATLLDAERSLVVLDSGLRQQLFTPAQLASRAEVMGSWPGSLGFQVVTRLADGRSGSVGESRCRYLFWRCGLPAPELQYEVHDELGLVGICDFAWPEHGLIGEFDGKVKYGALLRDGETPSDAVFREKQREDRLRRATGFRVVRITWEMLAAPLQTAAYVRALLDRAA
jgi:hypothetical protein